MCIMAFPTWNLQPAAKTRVSHVPPGHTGYVLGIKLLHPDVAQGDSLARGEDNHGAQDAEALGLRGGTELHQYGYQWYC